MEFYRYLAIIRRRWVLVVVTLSVAVFAGWLITPRDALYTATNTIYVGNRVIDFQGDELDASRAAALDRLLTTYSYMLDSEEIASEAIRRTGVEREPETIVDQTVVGPRFLSTLLDVRVTDRDPAVARDIANALADTFVEQVQRFEGTLAPADIAGSGEEGELPPGLPARVFERATLPTDPQPSDLLTNILLAGLFGLLASCLLAFALEYLDITVRSASDAERRLDLPVLGVVPKVPRETLGFVRTPVIRPGATPAKSGGTGEEPAHA